MNIRPLEDLTKEELIELVKQEREHIADVGKMGAPTDTQMLDWLIEKEALICHSVTANLYEIWFDIDNVETGKTAREAITKAMRGEK